MWTRVNGNTWREGDVYRTYRTLAGDTRIMLANFRRKLTNSDGLTFEIHVERCRRGMAVMVAEYRPYARKAYEAHRQASYLLSELYARYKKGTLNF